MRWKVAAGLVAVLALAGCGGGTTASDAPGDGPVAIATTNILGSVLGQISTCAGAESSSLMGPGDDPHTFAPSSAQVADLARTKLVVANGLGLEERLSDALAAAAADGATVLEVAPEVDPIPFGEAEHDEADHAPDAEEHAHGSEDPHFWMDIARMAHAATLIGDKLTEVTGDEAYTQCAQVVQATLLATDADVRAILDEVPDANRVLVTDHEAFGYFAQAYDFRIEGVVVPGGSTDAEPSSQELAALVDTIKATGTKAIFANTAVSSRLVDAVAAEVGTDIAVVQLYVGSLGPAGSGAETYTDMMLTNARLIADALR